MCPGCGHLEVILVFFSLFKYPRTMVSCARLDAFFMLPLALLVFRHRGFSPQNRVAAVLFPVLLFPFFSRRRVVGPSAGNY